MNELIEEINMLDKIEKIGKSLIQHGKFNNRIYLLKLDREDDGEIISTLEQLAFHKGYSKIFCKIHPGVLPSFLINGYAIEAFIPRFFEGKTDCLIVSKFFDEERGRPPVEELKLFSEWLKKGENSDPKSIINNSLQYKLCNLGINDVISITELFKKVFETYPFPVHDPDYILKTMREAKAKYFGIRDGDKLIAVSTAEVDIKSENAEMTDFAVLPEYRGAGIAYRLLHVMEEDIKADDIKTVYTIARLREPGMNITFIRAGYKYSGTLVNNTNIGGEIDSMNIFYKHL
jgi:beta-lysine N6-acetyltransferase